MKTETKLNNFFENELKSDLKDLLITRDQKGRYSLYGRYTIVPNKKGLFRVYTRDINVEFELLRNALAWCVLHHAKKSREASRIEELDLKLSSVKTDLLIHKNMLRKNSKKDTKWIYINKIQEDNIKKYTILNEIKTHINSSRCIQNNKFGGINQSIFRYE
jgi:hypothetical protein